MKTHKVLIVDDSALMRKLLTDVLSNDPELEVVAAARDPYDAWEKIKKHSPDVVTLDVEMPKMDGIVFLQKLMVARPLPVVMISTLTENGCETTLRALELGAVDFVAKPKLDVRTKTLDLANEITTKVKVAAHAKPRVAKKSTKPLKIKSHSGALIQSTHKVIAIGSSTGGTEALLQVLTALPADAPGIVIVQHMPSGYTNRFATRLNERCKISVREAQDGDRILPGLALLAPGGKHMEVRRAGASYQVALTDGPAEHQSKPSVDVMFRSCAKHIGKHTISVILTGMGKDGASGMQTLAETGARTIAQNEETCVVFGMPREAIATGVVQDVLPLDEIAECVLANKPGFNHNKTSPKFAAASTHNTVV